MATGDFDITTRNNNQTNLRITQANPPNECRQIGSGIERTNFDIFDYLNRVGLSKNQLEVVIPSSIGGLHFIGILYGQNIYLDHNGRFQFGEEDGVVTVRAAEKQMVVMPEELICDHGFVVRDIVGENRFLCKECNERFPRHPSMIPKKIIGVHTSSANVQNTLSLFREGMITFSQAVKETALSTETFKEAMQKAFPPEPIMGDFRTIGALSPVRVIIDEGPKRVSCYKEVEDVFCNPNVTVDGIHNIMTKGIGTFTDITDVTHVMDDIYGAMIIEITFVDGSVQRVEISADQLMRGKPWE